jgi:hypothetical protein
MTPARAFFWRSLLALETKTGFAWQSAPVEGQERMVLGRAFQL